MTKMKIWENMGTLMHGTEVLNIQVLHAFSIRKIDLQGPQAPENKDCSKENVLLVEEYHIRE